MELGKISGYRNLIFGIAIISIMVFHFSEDLVMAIEGERLEDRDNPWMGIVQIYYKYIKSIGVEIFAFLSGVGLFYSFSREPRLRNFYIKRLDRVLLPYLIVGTAFWGIKDLVLLKEGPKAFLEDITFVSFFTDGTRTIWYVGFILAMYLIYPLVYNLLGKEKNKPLYFFLVIGVAYAVPVLLGAVEPELFKRISIGITRIPVFIIGCYVGRLIKENVYLPKIACLLIVAMGIGAKIYIVNVTTFYFMGINVYGGVVRYVDSVYGLSLIILMVWVLPVIKEGGAVAGLLNGAGVISLELYLTHITIRHLARMVGIETYNPLDYGIIIVVAVILAKGIAKIENKSLNFRRREAITP
ncbi:MAG: acyltransferase [Anaerovoracaceae bacterium]